MSHTSEPTAASIFERAKGLLMAPRVEWPKIAGEPANRLPAYVTALAGFAVACGFLRDLMGYEAFGITYRPTLFNSLTSAVWTFVWQLAAVYLSGLALAWLAPRFGGERDRTNAYRLAGYSATASWLATFFLLVPGLGFLTLLGLYSVYLVATGAPEMLKVPRERVLAFTASFVGICIVACMVFFTFIRPFLLTHKIPDGPVPAGQSEAGAAKRLARSALVLAVLLLMAILPHEAAAATGKLKLSRSHKHPEVLVMTWTGTVRPGMAKAIRKAFDKHKDKYRVIEFIIDSGGGSVYEGERVIALMSEIKKTHRLYTGVLAGKKCGSMCVFLYVQGQKRFAAPASIWLFHEVSRSDKKTHKIYELDRPQWEHLIEKYWVPAGVNPVWIAEMKQHTFQADYFQTGQDLIEHDSGIIHKALSDERRRKVFPRETTTSH